MGRGSYEALIKTYNRSRKSATKVVCECGKHLFESQLERHLQTIMHNNLMRHKEQYNQFLLIEEEHNKTRLGNIEKEISLLLSKITNLESEKLKVVISGSYSDNNLISK